MKKLLFSLLATMTFSLAPASALTLEEFKQGLVQSHATMVQEYNKIGSMINELSPAQIQELNKEMFFDDMSVAEGLQFIGDYLGEDLTALGSILEGTDKDLKVDNNGK